MKRYLPALLAALLTGFHVWYGLIPALSRIDTDFPNYYTSARLVLEGRDLTLLYDDGWFQKEIKRLGMEQAGKFSPFPPITALVMVPVAWMDPLPALRAWTAVNLVLAGICAWFLGRISGRGSVAGVLLLLGTGLAFSNNLRFGQTYLLLLTLMSGGLWCFMNRRDQTAGILIGSGALLKYFPAVLVPLFFMRRGRLAVLWLAGTMVAMSLGATFLLGIDVHLEYLTSVLPSHLAGATLDDYAVTFQSFRTLYNRYYIPHPEFNLSAPYDWAAGGQIMLIATQFIVLGALLIGLRRLGATSGPGDRPTPFSDDERICLHLSLLTVVTLLLSPGSATYHFIILAIPAALALRCGASFRRIGLPLQIAILAAAGIGFLPYSVFRTFENSGMLMALAYPRLLALMVIFSGILCYIMIRVRKNH